MVKNNLIIIESISAKLSDMEHKMNYVLLSLKYLIIKRSENEALNLIDKNLWNLSKMTYYVNTKNPYFDNLFAGVLKKISQKNISPIIICEVEKGRLDKNIYLTSVFIEAIDKISEFLKESQKLKIEIHSHVNYICLSVFLLGDNLDEISKIEIDTKNFKENNINFTCNSIEQNMLELKFVVMEATE